MKGYEMDRWYDVDLMVIIHVSLASSLHEVNGLLTQANSEADM